MKLSHRDREDLKVTWQVWQFEQEVNRSLNSLRGSVQIAATDLLLGLLCGVLAMGVILINLHGEHLRIVEDLQAQLTTCTSPL